MRSSFSSPEFGSGVTSEVKREQGDTENRTWGEFASDVAIDAVGRPIVGALRTGAQAWRYADPASTAAETTEQGLGAAEHWLEDQRSARARALDTQSIDPRADERSFWKEPIAGSVHAFLPSVPYAVGALATAGGSLLARGATAGAMGALGAGEAVNDLRDYAEQTPIAELQQSPVWQKLYREYGGDERAARSALFKEMLDPKSQAVNFLVNAMEVPAFRMGMRPSGSVMRIVDRAKAAGMGAAVGGTQGSLEGGTEAYIAELGKVRAGQQQAINTDEITSGALSGAVFAGPTAAFHAIAPTYKQRATPADADVGAVANEQLNPPPDQTPPTPQQPVGPPPGSPGTPGTGPTEPPAPTPTPPPRRPRPAAAPVAEEPEAPPMPPGERAPPGEPPALDDAVGIFKTARGSEYFMFPDGTTVRNKAPRDEHPGDEGWKARSEQTFFVSPEHANQLSLLQAETRFRKRLAQLPDGRIGVQYVEGPSAGKFERRTVGRGLEQPEVGAVPLEMWNGGRDFHFGNPITEFTPRPTGEAYGPPTEPEGPQLPQPRRLQPGRMVWSGEGGFITPVTVMDQPPVYEAGRWMQPVAYTNPRTGETREMLAPMDELQPVAGPPAPGRSQEPPPVMTPEAPGAPQFPEIETPGRPQPTDFPVEEEIDLGTAEPPDDGTLSTNPVLRELQQRFRQERGEEREVEESTERARQRRINMERAERMPETDWRDVRPPEQRPTPPRGPTPLVRVVSETIRREQQPLRTVSERLRYGEAQRRREAEEGRRTTAFQERAQLRRERQEQEADRRRQGREEAAAAATADREERAAGLERRHPLLGGELRDERLRTLRDDVLAYNARAKEARDDQFMSKADRDDLRVDRQVLERRLVETPNADTLGFELEGFEPHTVKAPTQEDRARQEFYETSKRLGVMASRGELLHDGQPNSAAAQLVRKLENINYQRSGLRRVDGVEVRGRKAAFTIPGELYDRLVAAGLVKTPEQQTAATQQARLDSAAIQDAMRRRAEAAVARQGASMDTAQIKALARRMRRQANPNAPTLGLSSQLSKKHRDEWAEKTPLEKRRLRTEARIQSTREWEDIIRELVAQREKEARARTERGKPPLQERTTIEGGQHAKVYGTTEMQKMPTEAEALQQWREGRRAQREAERGAAAVESTRDRFVADRENIARDTILDAIKKRFPGKNSQKNFLALLDRLASVPANPPRRPGNINVRRDNLPADQRQRLDAWETAAEEWLDKKEEQTSPKNKKGGKGDAVRLKEFLEYTIQRIRQEIDAHKARRNIVRADARNLAQPVWDGETGRYTFRSGVNEPTRDYYNFANDLQKMDENLRAMQVALGHRPAPGSDTAVPLTTRVLRQTGPRRRALGDLHETGDRRSQMQTYYDEFQRATRGALGEQLQDFRMDMRLMLEGKMSVIRERRAARVEETSQNRRITRETVGLQAEAETELPPKSASEERAEASFTEAELHKLDEDITGGSLAALSGRNVPEEMTLRKIELRQQLAGKKAEIAAREAGQEFNPRAVARRQATELERTFPLRWRDPDATPEQLRIRAENLRKAARRGIGSFDEEGLPTNRLGPHEEFTPYTAEEQRYLDATDDLNNSTAITHPMISPVETSQATLDRVKDMVAKGQTGIVPTQYVTDQFLDRLAAINFDTETYHAPYDAVGGLENEAPAHYNTVLDRIVLSSDVSPDLYVRSALHENVHAATERSLLLDDEFRDTTTDLMQRAITAAQRQGVDLDRLPRHFQGLVNPSEFIAEMTSNQKFREFLFRVPAPHNKVIQGVKNVLNAMYHAIAQAMRKVFGNAKDGDTALDILFYDQSTVLGQTEALVARKLKQLERQGRPDRRAAVKALYDEPGKRYLSLSGGAQAFRDGLKETYDRTAFQLNQIKTENRAPGMAWRTMDQMTRIGSPEFQELTGDLNRIFQEMQGTATQLRDADKRELAVLTTIWNGWSREGRLKAGQFMIDEGMHTAFADAPLGEYGEEYLDQDTGERKRDLVGKNKHINPTLLSNAQVVHEHPRMQRQLQEMSGDAALPRFAEFRDTIYKFTAKREDDIRRNSIRDQWAVSDFLPDNLSAKERDTLLDALRDWTDESAKLSTAQQSLLRRTGFLQNKKAIEHRDDIRAARELAHLEGPYSPFTRFGDWALNGRFKIEKPENALILAEDINEVTGQPADDARFVFPTREEAEEMVHNISDQYGIAQLDGGTVWIDTTTGERPRVPDKRNRGKQRIATEREIENHPNAEKIEQYHYVTFQPKLLEMHGSQYDAEQARKAWLEDPKYKGKLDLSRPMDVFRHDARQNEHYTSTQMQNLISATRASAAYQRLDQNEQAAITRQMNLASEKFALRRGFKQRYLPRNYVKGVSRKVLASLDDYSTTSARYIAKVKHSSQLKEAGEKVKGYLKGREYEAGDRNYVAQRRVEAAMMRRIHSPTRNPHETIVSRNLDRAMRVTMIDKLPSVAYFTVNSTETAAIGIPLMSGRHKMLDVVRTMGRNYRVAGAFTRFAKAAKKDLGQALRRGTDMTNFMTLFNDTIDQAGNRLPYGEGLKDLIKQAASRNLFDVSAGLEYQSSFETSRKGVDVALDWAQGVFQAINTAIENLSRFVTLSTAYELEMRRLAGNEMTAEQRHKAASDYAMDMLHQVNGVYANYNAPEMFTREGPLGMLGPVIFQFKKWPQRITMIYLRTGLGLLKGLGDWSRGNKMSAENREMARQFIFMVAMVGLLAGSMGLPLEPFSHTVNLAYIMGMSPYNWDDVQSGFRVWMAKHGGADLAQLVAHGPLSFATGIDFAGRLSQSNMWAYGSPGSTKVRDLYGSLMQLLGGATLGTGAEIITGMQSGVEAIKAASAGADDLAWKKGGEFLKGVVPIRIAADVLGSFTGAQGTELASGRKLGPDYTPFEQAARAAGFTPTRESEAREARNAVVSLDKREAAGRKSLIDMFTKSPPGAQREAVWKQIQSSWNPSHPGYEITREELLKADRSRSKAKAEPREQLGIPQNKRIGSLMPMTQAYGL